MVGPETRLTGGPCDSLWRLMLRLTRIGLAVLVTILCAGCSARSARRHSRHRPRPTRFATFYRTAFRSSSRSIAPAMWSPCSCGSGPAPGTRRATSWGSRTTSSTCSSRERSTRPPGFVEREVEGGRWPDQRGHVVGLHLLSHGGAGPARDGGHRDARRRRGEREPRRKAARGREAGGARGDATERGQPAPVPGPAALRLRLRGTSVRTTGDRHQRSDPRAQPRHAGGLLPAALRARALRARGGRRREARRGVAGGAHDAGRAAARGGPALAAAARARRRVACGPKSLDPARRRYLGMAWHAPRLDHADTPALDLLMSILGRTQGFAPGGVAARASGPREQRSAAA